MSDATLGVKNTFLHVVGEASASAALIELQPRGHSEPPVCWVNVGRENCRVNVELMPAGWSRQATPESLFFEQQESAFLRSLTEPAANHPKQDRREDKHEDQQLNCWDSFVLDSNPVLAGNDNTDSPLGMPESPTFGALASHGAYYFNTGASVQISPRFPPCNLTDMEVVGSVEAADTGQPTVVDPVPWGPEITTVMIRRVPRPFTQRMLLQELTVRGFDGLFNFLYLPFEVKQGVNVGYGFINFVEPKYAQAFRNEFDGIYLDKQMKMKGRPIRVHPAAVQGYEANHQHFMHTKTGQKQDPIFSPIFLGPHALGQPLSLPSAGVKKQASEHRRRQSKQQGSTTKVAQMDHESQQQGWQPTVAIDVAPSRRGRLRGRQQQVRMSMGAPEQPGHEGGVIGCREDANGLAGGTGQNPEEVDHGLKCTPAMQVVKELHKEQARMPQCLACGRHLSGNRKAFCRRCSMKVNVDTSHGADVVAAGGDEFFPQEGRTPWE
mmetsp:Transcript_6533/g.12130  ORF Transcript_6533/g.12130 Transcript_6533/m.12130 type:complete len:494 (-) Transcript_6533:154-1635(-)